LIYGVLVDEFLAWYLLIAPIVFLFILYFVIRNAVRAGIQDVGSDRLRGGPPKPHDLTA
jgi:hypothetical protein